MLTRRDLVTSVPLLVVPSVLAETSFRVAPPPISPYVLGSYGIAQRNLASKIYGSGANSSDLAQAYSGFADMYSQLASTGMLAKLDAAIAGSQSAILNFNPSSINTSAWAAQLSTWAYVNPSDLGRLFQSITPSVKQQALSYGAAPAYQSFLSSLDLVRTRVGSGTFQRNEVGWHPCAAGIIAAIIGIMAIFAPQVEVGILFGVVLTYQSFWVLLAALYTLLATFTC